ncbi:MAG: hypothetical protein WCK31_02765 [bacterium]
MKKFITAGFLALCSLAFPIQVLAQSSFDSSSDSLASSSANAFFTAYFLTIIICGGILLLIGIIVPIVIYFNAKNNNIENAGLWFLLTLVLGILNMGVVGWIMYPLLKRKNSVASQTYVSSNTGGSVTA